MKGEIDIDKALLDKELLRILKQVKSYPNTAVGLCCNVYYIAIANWPVSVRRRISQRLTEIFVKWDKYSGNENYPVPGGYHEYHMNNWRGTVWEGEYGALRRELLDFVINYLEEK